MKYENDELGVSFSIPDAVSVRRQLEFRESVFVADGSIYARYWAGARDVIDDWQCEVIPDIADFDMDAATSKLEANIVNWVANTVAGHMDSLEDVPKNS